MQRVGDYFLFQISANSHKSIGNRYINSLCWIFMNALYENIHNCTSCLAKSSWTRHSSNLTFPTKITLFKVAACWLILVSILKPLLVSLFTLSSLVRPALFTLSFLFVMIQFSRSSVFKPLFSVFFVDSSILHSLLKSPWPIYIPLGFNLYANTMYGFLNICLQLSLISGSKNMCNCFVGRPSCFSRSR